MPNTNSTNSSKKRLVAAICGIGRAGSIHLSNCIQNSMVKLKYLVDLDVEKIQNIKVEFYLEDVIVLQVDQFYKVLEDEEVNGVIISTPTYAHEDLVKQCIKGGKAVFCEKPVSQNAENAKSCYEEADKSGVPLFCAFNRRFDKTHLSVKTASQNGEIGTIHMVKTCSRDSPLPSIDYLKISGGIFHDCAVHDIDMILWILQEYPKSIFSHAHAFCREIASIDDADTVSISMKFPSGALGHIDLSRFASYGYDQRVEVFGDAGMLESLNHSKTGLRKSNDKGLCTDTIDYSFPQRFSEAYKAELSHFVEIVTEFVQPSVTKDEVLVVSLVASACEESYRTGTAMKIDYKKMDYSPVS